ncbi:MAG: methylenetetrahydrofolate reductase [Thermodesulfobacteriota bacterium]
MLLREKLERGKFVVTCEINPPKGVEVADQIKELDSLKGRVDAVAATDSKSSVMTMSALIFSYFLKERGFEPILNLSCRDRNRLALQADLLGAAALGIQNILVVTGDYASMGDHPQAKPVFDLDAVQLLKTLQILTQGQDLGNNFIKGKPTFFPGATVSPLPSTEAALELQLIKMEKKAAAGAKFFITQPIFDLRALDNFMKRVVKFKLPVLASILPLKSVSMARFLNKNMPGIFVPEEIINEMANAPDRVKGGIEISAKLIRRLLGICQGIHLIPAGWEKFLPSILDTARI